LAGLLVSPSFGAVEYKSVQLATDAGVPELGGYVSAVALHFQPSPPLRPFAPRSPPVGQRSGTPWPPADVDPLQLGSVSHALLKVLGLELPRIDNAATRKAWRDGLFALTDGNSHLDLDGFTSGWDNVVQGRVGLTPAGQRALCLACGVRSHPSARGMYNAAADAGGEDLQPHGESVECGAKPFISFAVVGGTTFDMAGVGGGATGFCVGRVVAMLSIPHVGDLRTAPGPRYTEPPMPFFVAQRCTRSHEEEAELVGRIPAMKGVQEPWKLHPDRVFTLHSRSTIRNEHFQPRFKGADGDAAGAVQENRFWRFPCGGMEGKLTMLPLPEGADEVDEDAEQRWANGEGEHAGDSEEEEVEVIAISDGEGGSGSE
jgi:hypothetical protein